MTRSRPTVTDALPVLKRLKRARHRVDLAIWNLERLRLQRAAGHLARAQRDLEGLLEELKAIGRVGIAIEAR